MVGRLAPVRFGRDRIDIPVAVMTWVATWLLGQVLFVVVTLIAGADGSDPIPIPTLALGMIATWTAALAGLWWASVREGSGDPRVDYALEIELVDVVAIPVGVLAQLVLIPVAYVPLRWMWPSVFSEDRLEETARDLVDRAGGTTIVLLVFVVVVGAPIVEELLYRGLLQASFAARISDPLALVAASVWFAVIHFRPVELPGLFLAGMVFGGCFLLTGRLGTAVVAHASFNLTGLLTVWSST